MNECGIGPGTLLLHIMPLRALAQQDTSLHYATRLLWFTYLKVAHALDLLSVKCHRLCYGLIESFNCGSTFTW